MKLYSAKFRCNTSVYTALIEVITQIIAFRWQIIMAIKTKIKATYHQDVLGLFWSYIMPIIPMGVYMLLAHIKVFNTSLDMPFVFYIATGMMVWLLMADIMRKVMYSIKQDKSILTTTNFPIIVIMLSQLGEVIHDTLIRFISLALIIVYFDINISILGVIYALLALIPAIMIAFSIGMMLSIMDVVVQDTRRLVGIFLRYGLFLSSVIFPFPTEGIVGTLNSFNFFNTYVNAVRDFLFYGNFVALDVLAYTSLFAIIMLLFTFKIVYNVEYKIRAYL